MIRTKDLPGIFVLAILWSPAFLLVRVGVETLNPFFLTFIRVASSAAAIFLYLLIKREKIFSYFKQAKHLIISGLFLNTIPFTLCALGEKVIDSSTAGIIEGGIPIFTLVLSVLFFNQKKMGKRHVICVLIGFVGLLITFIPTLLTQNGANIRGFFCLVGMAFFFSLGFLYSEKFANHLPPTQTTAFQMLFASISLLPSCFIGTPALTAHPGFMASLLSILGLGIIGTALSWLFYFSLLKRTSAHSISIAPMVCPIFAIFLSSLILGEAITIYKVLGISVILSGVFFLSEMADPVLQKMKMKPSQEID